METVAPYNMAICNFRFYSINDRSCYYSHFDL